MRHLPLALVLSGVFGSVALSGVLGSYAPSEPVAAPAQSDWIEPVDNIGGRIRAVAISGEVAWIAEGPRVWAADVSGPGMPTPLGAGLLLEGQVAAVAADGARGVAGAGDQVFTLDLTNAATPRRLAAVTVGVPRGPRDRITVEELLIVGDAAYVLTGQYDSYPGLGWKSGVHVVDIRDSSNPVVTAEMAAPTLASPQHMLVIGNTLVVQTVGGVSLVDVTQPLNPEPAGVIATDVDTFAAHPDGSLTGIISSLSGGRRSALTLSSWDVSDPALPVQTATAEFTVGDTWGRAPYDAVYTADGRLFVSGDMHVGSFYTAGGLYEVKPSGTAPYERVRMVRFILRPLDSPLAAHNGRLLAGGPDGLFVYGGAGEPRHDLRLPVNVQGLEAHHHVLLANVDSSGLFALDVTTSPPSVAGHAASAATSGLSLGGAIASTDFYGETDLYDVAIHVATVSDLGTLNRTAKIDLKQGNTRPLKFAQSGATLAIAAGPAVHTWDLTDPAAPRRTADVDAGGPVLALALGEDGLMVVTSGTPRPDRPGMVPIHLAWYRRTTHRADAPFELVDERLVVADATANGSWTSASLAMSPGLVAVSFRQGCADRGSSGGTLVYQTWHPRYPDALVSGAWLPGVSATALLFHDGYLFQAWPQGVTVVDLRQLVSAPWAFAVVGTLRVAGAVDMAVLDGRVYVSTGANGIAVFEPDVDWASEAGAPTPTPFRVTPLPLTPTPTFEPCATITPTSTRTGGVGTPTRTPDSSNATSPATRTATAGGGALYLPSVRRE